MTVKEFKIQYALGSLSYDIKRGLAMNSYTPIQILLILCNNDDIEHFKILYWAASNYARRKGYHKNRGVSKVLDKLIKNPEVLGWLNS